YRKTLEIDPNFAVAHGDLAEALEHKGMYKEAAQEWQKSLVAYGQPQIAEAIGAAYSKSGYKAVSPTWIAHLTSPDNHSYFSPHLIAMIYARQSDKDRAFEWLAKAYQARSSDLVFLRVQPAFDSLRSDPRYAELERSIGFPQ